MTAVVENGDGTVNCFETGGYLISTERDMHPAIISVKLYNGTRLIAKKSRRFAWWYKHVTYKSEKVQNILKKMIAEQQEQKAAEQAESQKEEK